MIQENRTFNNLFAGFPGADQHEDRLRARQERQRTIRRKRSSCTAVNLTDHGNVTHLYKAFLVGYNNGDMDGFNLIKYVVSGKPEGKAPYQYVKPASDRALLGHRVAVGPRRRDVSDAGQR